MHKRRIQYERILLPALALSAACHLLAALVPAGAVDFLLRREARPARTVRFEVVELLEEPLRLPEIRDEQRPPLPHTEIFGAPPPPRPRQSVNWQLAAVAPDLSSFVKPEPDIVAPPQPPPAVTATDSAARINSYISQVLARIEQARLYPETARRMGQQGAVEVAFAIGRDGAISRPARLVMASPFGSLNRAACNSIKRSDPFPSLPPCIIADTLSLVVTIKFQLH